MGETLKRKFGPLPVWAWALILVVLVAAYLSYRKKATAAAAAAQQASQNNLSSNLGTVPVSNLTTAAQPMPIQLGDTFVNTSVNNSPNKNPWGGPPSGTMRPGGLPALFLKIGQAENTAAANLFGGGQSGALAAMSAAGLTQQDVQALAAAGAAGGTNYLTEANVAQQAGLTPQQAGITPSANQTSYNGTPL